MYKLPLLTAVLAALAATQGGAATLVVSAIQDATLFEDSAGAIAAGASDELYAGRVGTNTPTPLRRSLVQFDLSALPAGSVIDRVSLTMSVVQVRNENEAAVSLHRVTNPWVEGNVFSSTGNGSAAAPGDATWLHRSSPVTWTTAGGDFIGVESDSQIVSAAGLYTWSGAGLTSDVQSWLNNSGTNFGWLLRGNETVSQSVKVFASSEAAAGQPALTINYTAVPESSSMMLASWALFSAGRRRRTPRRISPS